MKQPPHHIDEDLQTRWIDGQLTPDEAALVEKLAAATPELHGEKRAADQVGTLLRKHLPVSLDPPSPEFFTSSIMEEIRSGIPASPAASGRPSAFPSWLRWIRAPWFGPLASGAAVALAFLIWNHRPVSAPAELAAQTYTPDPRITASAFYSEEAEATVIDLQNLEAVPDDHEIRAFDVASSNPGNPGEPLIFYAASDETRPVLVLSKDSRDTPRVTTIQ